jgi:diguanylate cyclase (GGDEF)-like protein
MLNIMMLTRILSADYVLLTATSGEAALSLALKQIPDLILLDVIMPGMDGFEVLTELKRNPETMNIPVIFITGADNEEDEERGFLLGAVDYITKPFKNVIVKVRVNTHMKIVSQLRMNERLGMIDPLTGIHNRRSFDHSFEAEWGRAVREKTPISFLMLDIDHFKKYNDAFGHLQGDELLKAAAAIFVAVVKRPTDLAARLGGEEFGILLPGAGPQGALAVAEEVRKAVEALQVPTIDGKQQTTATVSIGVASISPVHSDSPTELLSRADDCLYAAKESGRNKVIGGELK